MTSYFQHPNCSNSALSKLARELSGQPDRDLTEAYRFGSLFDAVVTEPHNLDLIRMTILGTEYSFTTAEHEVCKMMRASFVSDPFCAGLMKTFSMQHEVYVDLQFYWAGLSITLPFKGKFDFYSELLKMVVDLKSTAATTQAAFEAACMQFGYWRQMVVYMLLSGSQKAMLVGVSKIKPYRLFKVTVVRGDARWNEGFENLNELAYKYWIIKN